MIGRALRSKAPVVSGVLVALLLGGVLAARSPDPLTADPAAAAALRSTIAAERAQAEAQLFQLETALSAALEDGRDGAALTVQGTERPGPHLSAAADAVGKADPLVGAANETIRRLAANLAVAGHAGSAPSLGLEPGQLAGIGAQLQDSADAADAFWSMRRATETTLVGLADAFEAIDAEHPARALAAVPGNEMARQRAYPAGVDPGHRRPPGGPASPGGCASGPRSSRCPRRREQVQDSGRQRAPRGHRPGGGDR